MSASFHYQLGHIAALRGIPHEACPCTGRQRAEWMDGHYDGWLERERIAESARIEAVMEQRQRSLVFARTFPRRHSRPKKTIRNPYARQRIEQIIAERKST